MDSVWLLGMHWVEIPLAKKEEQKMVVKGATKLSGAMRTDAGELPHDGELA